jgi:hypothetical protein
MVQGIERFSGSAPERAEQRDHERHEQQQEQELRKRDSAADREDQKKQYE